MNADSNLLLAAATWWEYAGYAASGLLLAGGGLAAAQLTRTAHSGRRKERAARALAFLLLITGLAAEIVTQVQSHNQNNLLVGQLNDEAAEAIRAATQAKLELAKLVAPRTLTPDQQSRVAALLKDAPKGAIAVIPAYIDATDAHDFAESIKATLRQAGFTPQDRAQELGDVLSWGAPGQFLIVQDAKQQSPLGAALQRAFAAVDIFFPGESNDKLKDPSMVVLGISSHPFRPTQVPPGLTAITR